MSDSSTIGRTFISGVLVYLTVDILHHIGAVSSTVGYPKFVAVSNTVLVSNITDKEHFATYTYDRTKTVVKRLAAGEHGFNLFHERCTVLCTV